MKLRLLSLTCSDRFMLGTVSRVGVGVLGVESVGYEVVEDSEDNDIKARKKKQRTTRNKNQERKKAIRR
jgi:hypothetical protein